MIKTWRFSYLNSKVALHIGFVNYVLQDSLNIEFKKKSVAKPKNSGFVLIRTDRHYSVYSKRF